MLHGACTPELPRRATSAFRDAHFGQAHRVIQPLELLCGRCIERDGTARSEQNAGGKRELRHESAVFPVNRGAHYPADAGPFDIDRSGRSPNHSAIPTRSHLTIMSTSKLTPFRAAVVAALVAISGTAQAQISNGSFELGSLVVSGFTQEITGSTNMTGWTVIGDNLAWFHASPQFGLSAAPGDGGVKFLDLTNLAQGCTPCGGVEQVITLLAGSYFLTFDLGSSSNFGLPAAIQATVVSGGTTTSNFVSTATGSNNWQTFTLPFTTAGGSATVRLVGTSTNPTDYVGLDRVAVTPIPEPGALALMLAGLAAVGSVASRRRTQG